MISVLAITATACGSSTAAGNASTGSSVSASFAPGGVPSPSSSPFRGATSTPQPVASSPTVGDAATRLNGRIAFMRWDAAINDQAVFTIDPDGSHERRLLPGAAAFPHWSPDGTQIAVLCCDAAARIVTVDSGAVRTLLTPDPGRVDVACSVWSTDGARLYCEGTGATDSSLNGIYSIRSSDGGDVQRLTVSPGNDDAPADASPDGRSLLILRLEGDRPGLYVAALDGSGMRWIDTGSLQDVISGSWSPTGAQIVFAARKSAGERRSVFVVGADSTALHEVSLDPACGGQMDDPRSRGCLDPRWSPDGTKVVLDILLAADGQKQIYTVGGDGSHLSKITHHGPVSDEEGEQTPDWGIHPLG